MVCGEFRFRSITWGDVVSAWVADGEMERLRLRVRVRVSMRRRAARDHVFSPAVTLSFQGSASAELFRV